MNPETPQTEISTQQAYLNSLVLDQQRKALPSRPWQLDTRAFGGRVNMDDEWEVHIWCRRFGCTARQLQEAIAIKGNSALALRRHFESRDAKTI